MSILAILVTRSVYLGCLQMHQLFNKKKSDLNDTQQFDMDTLLKIKLLKDS